MRALVGLAGTGLVIAGIAFLYWPAALIVAGMFFLRAYLNLEKADADARRAK